MTPTAETPTLGVRDLALRLGLSVPAIYRLHAAGKLPPPCPLFKRPLRWFPATIETWLAALAAGPNTAAAGEGGHV